MSHVKAGGFTPRIQAITISVLPSGLLVVERVATSTLDDVVCMSGPFLFIDEDALNGLVEDDQPDAEQPLNE